MSDVADSKKHCCDFMSQAVTSSCADHPDRFDCPEALINYSSKRDEYGLIIHDGGRSTTTIEFCPFCGASLDMRFTGSDSYKDRLAPETYQDDVVCEVRLQSEAGDPGPDAWLSARLLGRLRHLALAYDLNLLARLQTSGQVVYPQVQFALLEDELAFLFDVVSDPALLHAARLVLGRRDAVAEELWFSPAWSLHHGTDRPQQSDDPPKRG